MKKFLYSNLCLLLGAALWLSACRTGSEPSTSSSFYSSSSNMSSMTSSEDSSTSSTIFSSESITSSSEESSSTMSSSEVSSSEYISSSEESSETQQSFTIYFDTDGGSEIDSITLNYNEQIPSISNPTKEGYTFISWDKDIPTYMPSNDIYLKATWSLDTYSVSYHLDGGTNSESNPSTYTYEDETITLANPTKDYNIFLGWFDGKEYSNQITSIPTHSTGNIELYAAWFESDTSNLKYTINEDGASITGLYDNSVSSVVIPSLVRSNGKIYSVTSIGNEAFYYCSNLTSITIPNRVASIGYAAFSYCSSLTSITIPDSVTSIGSGAFSGCSSLTTITLHDSVTSIGNYAFRDCSRLTTITIPDSVTSIGSGVFTGCSSLTSITLPFVGSSKYATTASDSTLFGYIFGTSSYAGGVKTTQYYSISDYQIYYIPYSLKTVTITGGNILYGAFEYCSRLTSITIPDSVTSIGNYAFRDCSRLTTITIPDSVTSIGESTFFNCCRIVEVINKSILDISAGSSAYGNVARFAKQVIKDESKSKLSTDENGFITYDDGIDVWLINYIGKETSVIIPNEVTKINDYAFYRCDSLTSITLPNSVTSIGKEAFRGCSSLTSIILPDSITSIGNSTFYGCDSLTSITIPNGVTSIGNSTFYGCDSLTSITIPNGVTSIGNSAFCDCSKLTSIIIPNSVTFIGNSVFSGCSSLTSITLPDSITSIGEHAFSDCSSLTSIIIPNSVTSIGNHAFQDCGLTSITLPDSVTSIGERAFSGCSSLTSIIIPNSVTSIGKYAFSDCSSLLNVFYSGSKSKWLDITIGNNNECLTNASIEYNSEVKELKYVSTDKYSYVLTNDNRVYDFKIKDTTITSFDFENELPDLDVITLGNNAFLRCSSLSSIIIPDSVTSIGNCAFCLCDSLTSITLPDSVTSIGKEAFYKCSKLTSITIPDSVISIGRSAFSGCSNLTSITLPFVGHSKSATSPSSFTLFGYIFGTSSYTGGVETRQYYSSDSYIFYYIPSSLKTVTITGGNILYGSFYNCSSLTSVTIPDTVTSIGERAFSRCSKLAKVYYKGNNPYASTITNIGSYNDYLINATWYYFTENGDSETTKGNWWYYDTDGVTVIEKVIQ